MNVRMIVPVTPKLAGELAATERVLANLAKLEELRGIGNQRGLNDRDNYADVADTLEALAITTLSATSSVPLTKRGLPAGASFDLGHGTSLHRTLTAAVAYLKEDATGLLGANSFSQHKADHLTQVLGYLKTLNGELVSSIRRQAERDLGDVMKAGVSGLLMAADALAKAANPRKQDEAAPVDIREASVTLPDPR